MVKIKIGIVDDHVQTAVSISQMLEYNGFKTFQAYDGKKAIELAKEEKPSLMLVDVKMKGLSGYDVAKALPRKKIIFITGFDLEESEIKKYKNVIGVIQKPVDIEELLKLIKKVLKIK